MGIKVNLSGADADFEPLPSSRYLVKITDGEIRESGPNAKHPGAQYVNWEFTVQAGDYEGRRLWTNTMLTHEGCECGDEESFNKAIRSLVQLMNAIGLDTSSDEYDFDMDDFIGKDLVVVVTQREYEGEMRNDIRRFRPAGDLAGSEASLLP